MVKASQHFLVFVILVSLVMVFPPESQAKLSVQQPYVVIIYADWCPNCNYIKQTLKEVQKKYETKVKFISFDISNRKTYKTSQIEAKRLGLEDILAKYRTKTSSVVILHPKTKKILTSFYRERDNTKYIKAIDKAISL